jgi:hypothetical protein
MNSDVKVISTGDNGVDLFVRSNGIHLQVYEYYGKYTQFIFDLTNESHRQAIKNMIEVLQHQLDTCEE